MIIVGAGMSGLLAAHMLRRFSPVIHEAQSSLPNNHAALLRFRSDAVSRATGIPFRKVWVQKAICLGGQLYERGDIRLNNMYAAKVSGKIIGRSIMNLEPGERYIAPPDFIQQMSKSVNIEFGTSIQSVGIRKSDMPPMVSTMPMHSLMKMVKWSDVPVFQSQSIMTITGDIDDVDIYQTLYFPAAGVSAYRVSITGNQIIAECIAESELNTLAIIDSRSFLASYAENFGIYGKKISNTKIKFQKYGKILPIDNSIRKQFILAMTDEYRIYSIGRFATWRQLLMDDVVRDISLVEQMIEERSSYQSRLLKAV